MRNKSPSSQGTTPPFLYPFTCLLPSLAFSALLLFSAVAFAQNPHQPNAVITTGGEANASGHGSTSYTIGQIDFLFFTDENSGSINQGVQQPFEATIVALDKDFDLKKIRIYPNPVKSNLFIELIDEEAAWSNYRFRIYDLIGKFLLPLEPQSLNTQITCDEWPAGTYFIEIINPQKQKAIFKIIKL